jgi:2-methylisocitrate lyase-like PEP mutase family enzyme
MRTQAEKASAFQSLHARPGAFILPNPWDMGTARLLARLGFEALATTSAGFAFSVGRRDNRVGRDVMIAHVLAIASATDLPVSADLENCFADLPDEAAETIRLAAGASAVGGSIEDSTGRADEPIYEFELAVERVRAAAETARSLANPFTLTARCENFLVGRADLNDTIRRLQAYEEAGADVLYAPGLARAEDISAVVTSVGRPVNVLMPMPGTQFSLPQLAELGVKRVSVGSGLARCAFSAFLRAAHELRDQGTFTFPDATVSFRELNGMFEG